VEIGNRLGNSRTGRFCLGQASHFLVVAFTALTLFLQSYATQTHFHKSSESSVAANAHVVISQSQKGHLPSSNDSDNCPLCQSLYNGQYVTPNFASYLLPQLAVSIIEAVSPVRPHYDAVSHSWRGRGPPSI
jgi:hypothetical protein